MVNTQVGYQTQDEPNYRQLLRPIGAFLDRLQARFVTLGETEDGFVWHCFPNGDFTRPMSGMIAHADVPRLMDQLKAARRVRRGVFSMHPPAAKPIKIASRRDTVCPEGYEETFRSLGNKLDVAKAIAVLIVERKDNISVIYHFPTPGYLRRDISRTEFTSDMHEDIFNRDQVARLIATSRSYRNNRYFH
jgi:hypothetical protein